MFCTRLKGLARAAKRALSPLMMPLVKICSTIVFGLNLFCRGVSQLVRNTLASLSTRKSDRGEGSLKPSSWPLSSGEILWRINVCTIPNSFHCVSFVFRRLRAPPNATIRATLRDLRFPRGSEVPFHAIHYHPPPTWTVCPDSVSTDVECCEPGKYVVVSVLMPPCSTPPPVIDDESRKQMTGAVSSSFGSPGVCTPRVTRPVSAKSPLIVGAH